MPMISREPGIGRKEGSSVLLWKIRHKSTKYASSVWAKIYSEILNFLTVAHDLRLAKTLCSGSFQADVMMQAGSWQYILSIVVNK